MARPTERMRVMTAAIALWTAACGSITSISPADGPAPEGPPPSEHPEAATAKPDAGPDGRPDADAATHADAIIDAAADRVPDAGVAEVAPAEAHPDVDPRDCTIKINEVQTGGSGGALDEFVEIYNTCPDRAFALAGYALVYRSDVGTTNVSLIVFGSQAVAANRPFYLCANGSSTYTGPPADSFFTASGLRDVGGGLALLAPGGAIVDSVGWGTATNAFVEGTAAAAPAAGQSIARFPDGHDTGMNATDFLLRTAPTPGAPN